MKLYLPRSLRDDGMIEDIVGEHHPLTKYVTLDDYNQALAEKDREIEQLKEKVTHYDRWLSKGVYFTNEEFSERVTKPRQQLMGQAVRFAEKLGKEIVTGGFSHIEYPEEVQDFLSSPEVRKWREQEGKK